MIDAHLPVPPEDGQQEQRRHRPHPEQQIQQERQPPEARSPAKGTHQVVYQPKAGPQQHSLAEHRRLGQHVHPHIQRSNRAKKPPRPAE